jgi:hypothetical protein
MRADPERTAQTNSAVVPPQVDGDTLGQGRCMVQMVITGSA